MTKPFVRASEVWILNHDESRLELASANYGTLGPLAAASENMTFAYDEGLPGKAWATRHPIILKRFEQSYFKRTEVALQLGLKCAVALPIFSGLTLKGVAVLLCGDDKAHVGAVELWYNKGGMDDYLNFDDGYYGSASAFEWLSARTFFRKGSGLPGLVWQSNAPLIVPDLQTDERFLRKARAAKLGMNMGVGLPFLTGRTSYVVTMLSARDTPIARRIEIWRPEPDGIQLVFDDGACEEKSDFGSAYSAKGISRGDGSIGQVWKSGIPVVSAVDIPLPSIADRSAQSAGLQTVVAVPIINEGQTTSIVCWYF